jgi:hypothetical protein
MKTGPKDLNIKEFFGTPLWISETDVKDFNKYIDPYINGAKKSAKKEDVFYETPSLLHDDNFADFVKYIQHTTRNLLDESGYDLNQYNIGIHEMWAREFVPEKGVSVFPHCHKDTHLTGIVILKASKDTSQPVFYDPRPGKYMKDLPEKKKGDFTLACDKFSINVKPGMFLIFPSFLSQGFSYTYTKNKFRYLHFTSSAILRG